MPVTAVVGAQWGDEGKGKLVDILAQDADMVIRATGGNNAGHTIENEHTVDMPDGVARLHLIPAGIFNPDAICIIGSGTVIDLEILTNELLILQRAGVDTSNLLISKKAHLIMPWHVMLDEAEEAYRASGEKNEQIGTTKRGIGPTYSRKHSRSNLRVEDLFLSREEIEDKFLREYNYYKAIFEYIREPTREFYGSGNYYDKMMACAEIIKEYVADTEFAAWKALAEGKNILLEGAQGVLLDIDHGTYPDVTSSACTIAGLAQGSGIPPSVITERIAVIKAYTTRVGAGAFPTKLEGVMDNKLREWGNEYGATTGRPRMCGWIDMPLLRYAQRLNGFTSIAITKLDVLDNLPQFYSGVAYKCLEGNTLCRDGHSCGLNGAEALKRLYDGWHNTASARNYSQLPKNAKKYIRDIEIEMGCEAKYISVGPHRDETIIR